MKILPPRSLSFSILAGCLLLSGPGKAQTVYPQKLSESLVPGGDVLDFQFSPDGKRVVYLADHHTTFVTEIYSAPTTGGAAVKLNGSLVLGGDVFDFKISKDGKWVVYLADQETNQVLELYSVPIMGGEPVKLNRPLVLGGDVFDFRISEDGSCVVYRADQDTDQTFELYSVPIMGGTAEKLNGTLEPGQDVQADFQPSGDGSRVVYRADQDTNNTVELYSVPIVGGLPAKLNGPLPAGGDVFEFQIKVSPEGSPDSARVVYCADEDDDQVFELYSVPIEGGTVVKLNGPLTAGGNVVEFAIDPNRESGRGSIRVVYLADQEMNQSFELYSAPILGGGAVKISAPLVPGGDVVDLQFSEDGSRVVYRADQDADTVVELYSVPVEGGEVGKLNGALTTGGDVVDFEVAPGVDPDHVGVVYRADQDMNQVFELYSAPIRGGPAEKLNPDLLPGRNVSGFQVSPDGRRAGYLADQERAGVIELYNVPVKGGEALKVNGALMDSGDVVQFEFSPDGGRLAYRADQDTDGMIDLYVWVTHSPESYAEFAAFYGLLTAPDGDEEGDGLLNAFEYLTGHNPLMSDFGVELPKIERVGDEVRVSFVMVPLPAGSNLILELKSSATLEAGGPEGWQVIARRIGNGPWTGSGPVMLTPAGQELVRATVAVSTASEATRFYRLDLQAVP